MRFFNNLYNHIEVEVLMHFRLVFYFNSSNKYNCFYIVGILFYRL